MILIFDGRGYPTRNNSRSSALLANLFQPLATFLISLFQLRHNLVQYVSVRLPKREIPQEKRKYLYIYTHEIDVRQQLDKDTLIPWIACKV
jgi:hypothetical protein